MKHIVAFSILAVSLTVDAAYVNLYDWIFYTDGTTHEFANGDLPPSAMDDSEFDWLTGTGILSMNFGAVGDHTFVAWFDHEIDESINTYYNEYGEVTGTPEAGQTWEIDEPGILFGDIPFNVLDGTLDNFNNVTSDWADDVSMALGWEFALLDGESASLIYTMSDVVPASDFYLTHTDPDSDHSIYFSSTLSIESGNGVPAQPIPEPSMASIIVTGMLLFGFMGNVNRKWH